MVHTHKLSRGHKILLWVFVLGLFVPGAVGFAEKFAIFVRMLYTAEQGGFTIVPVLTYLLVACGMLCLFAWAVTHGMFRDIERPKYDMLEREKELDHDEGIEWEQER